MCIFNFHRRHVLSRLSKIEMAYRFKGKTLFGQLMQCPWHMLPVALPPGPRSALRALWPCGKRHQGKSGKVSCFANLCHTVILAKSSKTLQLIQLLIVRPCTDDLVKHWLQEQMPQDIMAESLVASSVLGPEWVYKSKGPAYTLRFSLIALETSFVEVLCFGLSWTAWNSLEQLRIMVQALPEDWISRGKRLKQHISFSWSEGCRHAYDFSTSSLV